MWPCWGSRCLAVSPSRRLSLSGVRIAVLVLARSANAARWSSGGHARKHASNQRKGARAKAFFRNLIRLASSYVDMLGFRIAVFVIIPVVSSKPTFFL